MCAVACNCERVGEEGECFCATSCCAEGEAEPETGWEMLGT